MHVNSSSEKIVAVIRDHGKIRWFRSDRDLWILDLAKWRKDFVDRGHKVPNFDPNFRVGIVVVDSKTKNQFLSYIAKDEVDPNSLSRELAVRYKTAESWWDVGDLFPIVFVDFDRSHLGAFYPGGTPMERYIPDSWVGEFVDFANEYPQDIFPEKDKFWIKGDCDLLKLLNERGSYHPLSKK